MGSLLAVAAGMRTIGLLITLLAVSPQAATDQKLVVPEGTVISSAQVTGFDIERLSPGLREEIRNLAGTPLKQQRLDELAARLEAERPRYVAAGRAVMDSDGQARVFFVMGRQSVPERDDNVNARYIVEQADITGVPDAELTQALARRPAGPRRQAPRFGRRRSSAGAHGTRASALRDIPTHPARERGWPHPARLRGAQGGAATVVALRAAPIERNLSLRPGLGQLPGPRHRQSQHPFHTNHRYRQRGRSRRGVLRLRVALRNEEDWHPSARRQPRVVPVRSRLAWRHAGCARARARDSSVRTTRDRRSRPC